jgi:hypothetical protein
MHNLANMFLFWFHLIFILTAVMIGLFVSPWLAVLLVFAHRAHVFIFNGCILSKIQRQPGGLPDHLDFLQLAADRIFHKNITSRQSYALDYFFASLPVIISLAK